MHPHTENAKSGLTFAPEARKPAPARRYKQNVIRGRSAAHAALRVRGAAGTRSNSISCLAFRPETDEGYPRHSGLTEIRCCTHGVCMQKNKNRGVRITVSTSCFVPKPAQPVQWGGKVTMEEYIRKRCTSCAIILKPKTSFITGHDHQTSYIEATLSRGDRRIGNVIEKRMARRRQA